MRCIVIGAGVSGLLIVQKIKEAFGQDIDIRIFEKNADIGGTWLENRYPGCACDVPSHIYQYSFAPNPYWSRLYASSSEIQHYLKAFARHFDLERHVELSALVTKAEWCEDKFTWSVEVDGRTSYECDLLINAAGILNNPHYPSLNNVDSFKGDILHTASWNTNISLKGKRLAIIGAGASAVQVLPALQPYASHIDIYIRTPSWSMKPYGAEGDNVTNRDYSAQEIARYANNLEYSLQQRKQMETDYNTMFRAFMKQSGEQRDLRVKLDSWMREMIKDKGLQQKLIPTFEAGCRRLNPSGAYLEALQEANVQPLFDPIQEVTSTGIRSGGEERHVDSIILATGFDTSFRPRFPIIGVNKLNLQTLWRDEPTAYFGLAVSGYPNYLMFLGPNTPISNGSLMGVLEATADYFVGIIRKMMNEDVTSFDISADAQADFNTHTQELMKNMVWTGTCRSWYKSNTSGRVTAIWPGSSLHYREVLASRRFEDFVWKYRSNRFTHWRDGLSSIELTDDTSAQDFSYYLHAHPNLPRGLFQSHATDDCVIDASTPTTKPNAGPCGTTDASILSSSSGDASTLLHHDNPLKATHGVVPKGEVLPHRSASRSKRLFHKWLARAWNC